MEKADNTQEQMSDVIREIEILRKNKKELLEMKNTATEIKNAFDGLISTLDRAEERISRLKGISIETSKNEKRSEKD